MIHEFPSPERAESLIRATNEMAELALLPNSGPTTDRLRVLAQEVLDLTETTCRD